MDDILRPMSRAMDHCSEVGQAFIQACQVGDVSLATDLHDRALDAYEAWLDAVQAASVAAHRRGHGIV